MTDRIENAAKVKQRYEKQWLGMKGVSAVGIGKVNDKTGIIVSVENDSDLKKTSIPEVVEGVPVTVQVAGKFTARKKI